MNTTSIRMVTGGWCRWHCFTHITQESVSWFSILLEVPFATLSDLGDGLWWIWIRIHHLWLKSGALANGIAAYFWLVRIDSHSLRKLTVSPLPPWKRHGFLTNMSLLGLWWWKNYFVRWCDTNRLAKGPQLTTTIFGLAEYKDSLSRY